MSSRKLLCTVFALSVTSLGTWAGSPAAFASDAATAVNQVKITTTSSSWSTTVEDTDSATDATSSTSTSPAVAGYVYPPGDANFITDFFDHVPHQAPYRTGVYNPSTQKGWGKAKVVQKHALTDVQLLKDGYKLATQQPSGPSRFVTRFQVNLTRTSDGQIIDSRVVRIVTDEVDKRLDELNVGVITAYCENPGNSCPSWVNNY